MPHWNGSLQTNIIYLSIIHGSRRLVVLGKRVPTDPTLKIGGQDWILKLFFVFTSIFKVDHI